MLALDGELCDEIKIISPDDGYHYFFAYYDMRATGSDGINQKHLCHRVKFMDRMPKADDVCEIGYLDGGHFFKIAETTAWNFQQGAMLQYHPNKSETVYYNVIADGKTSTVTHNFKTGEKSYTDMGAACISPDGHRGLAVNFARIYAFRPGYGYAGVSDKNADVFAPSDDGVFLVDMEFGKASLLLSYSDILPESGFTKNDKILVNHITFSPDSKRFIMLVRNFYTPPKIWSTTLMLCDVDGNFKTVLKNTIVSHYYWLNERELLAYCSPDGNLPLLYVIDVDSGECRCIDSDYFHTGHNGDIHCTETPNGKYVIGDGYPIDGYRHLVAINLESGESRSILKAKTVIPNIADIRCDLHARYVFEGKYVSFDTTHNGKREIAIFPTDKIDF